MEQSKACSKFASLLSLPSFVASSSISSLRLSYKNKYWIPTHILTVCWRSEVLRLESQFLLTINTDYVSAPKIDMS